MSAKKDKGGGAGDEAATQQRLVELRALKNAYTNQCRRYIVEPITAVAKRLERAAQAIEDVDKIIINNHKLAVSDVHALHQTFNTYSPLSTLCLWLSPMDPKALETLAKLVSTHPSLATLHLIDCNVTAATAAHIRAMCTGAKALTSIVLDHNAGLASVGVTTVFSGIMAAGPACVLKVISMRYCDIGARGAETVAAALIENTTITELDITGNRIGDEGLVHFARALSVNATLKILNAAANNITDREKLLPPQALATCNKALTMLDLRGNNIGETGGRCVLEMLKLRKAAALSKKAEPLEVLVTERMSGSLYEEIMDLNDAMVDIARKSQKKGGSGKKGGKGKKK
ncbi:hypothetical protein DFJ73DRAFT_622777 [Zopfochytrium polystomum]|nr:hypothetical protein DFJ73DRAFT_622777 [Zopfochytrium polystomum]